MSSERKIPGTNKSATPPPVHSVPKPGFPLRSGVSATGTAILIIVSMFCIFQYWLLTATLEAYHAGDDALPIGAFFASLGCFLLATGLAVLGEVALIKQQDFLRESLPHYPMRLSQENADTIASLHAAERNPDKH